MGDDPDKIRVGVYHGSAWPGAHGDQHAVGVHIDVDHIKLSKEGMLPATILDGCLKHLSTPPPKRPRARKDPLPKYGVLTAVVVAPINLKVDDRGPYISTVIFTDQPKVKAFWK